MTPSQKGAVAETTITAAATELGIVVLRPVNEGGRYDLVFDVAGRLLRIQCKWAPLQREVVLVRARTCRYGPTGHYIRTHYSNDEVDAIVGYCPELRRSFYVPIEEFSGQGGVHLRLSPARNNQRLGVRLADDFDLDTMLIRLGAVAQLGERRRGTAEARGSSPLSSIEQEAARPRGLLAVQKAAGSV